MQVREKHHEVLDVCKCMSNGCDYITDRYSKRIVLRTSAGKWQQMEDVKGVWNTE